MVICSVCYEDVKPECEHLQAIAGCGHVFHELCLQQWLEFCHQKPSCPLCKQTCKKNGVHRLYFSTSGECTQSKISECQDVEALQITVHRLEAQLSVAGMGLETYKLQLKELEDRLARDKALLEKASRERDSSKQAVYRLGEELEILRSDRSQLLNKNTSMAKELASVKLCTELNLSQEEIVRLSSMGQVHNKDFVIDTLSRSLVYRQEAHRELSQQLSVLAERESRTLQRAEQTSQQLKKAKRRVQELEKALESKDNENLRSLKKQRRAEKVHAERNTRAGLPCNTGIEVDTKLSKSSEERWEEPNVMPETPASLIPLVIRREAGVRDGASMLSHPGDAHDTDQAEPTADRYDNETRKQVYATAAAAFRGKGSFISSGADGRGGRVTVLKPPKSLGIRSTVLSNAATQVKRCKAPQPSKGSGLQIDHFFGRAE